MKLQEKKSSGLLKESKKQKLNEDDIFSDWGYNFHMGNIQSDTVIGGKHRIPIISKGKLLCNTTEQSSPSLFFQPFLLKEIIKLHAQTQAY